MACAHNDRNYLPSVHVIQVFQSRSSPLQFCDRVVIQSTDFYDDNLVSLVSDKCGLENGVLLSG